MLTAILRWWLALLPVLLVLPLLLVQARQVRRGTPALAPASGPTEGEAGTQRADTNPLALFSIGDSVAAGVGVANLNETIPAVAAAALAAELKRRVTWAVRGVEGDRVADVAARVATLPRGPFDVVLVSVGVNDVTGLTSLVRWQTGLLSLSMSLRERYADSSIVFLGLPPLARFPALPQPLAWALGARAALLGAVLRRVADLLPRVSLVDPGDVFDRAGMAGDGFHPGSVAHQAIGARIARQVLGEGGMRA